MSVEFETVMVVITAQRITLKVMDKDGRSISEEWARVADGTVDCVVGNFSDEPDLPDGLHGALMCLQDSVMDVWEQMQE